MRFVSVECRHPPPPPAGSPQISRNFCTTALRPRQAGTAVMSSLANAHCRQQSPLTAFDGTLLSLLYLPRQFSTLLPRLLTAWSGALRPRRQQHPSASERRPHCGILRRISSTAPPPLSLPPPPCQCPDSTECFSATCFSADSAHATSPRYLFHIPRSPCRRISIALALLRRPLTCNAAPPAIPRFRSKSWRVAIVSKFMGIWAM